jgi:hypothetical protein
MTPEDLVSKVRIGMTREEVKTVLGEPHDWDTGSRKHPRPSTYKYGEVELPFGSDEGDGLWLVYMEDEGGNQRVLLGGDP